MDSMGGVQRGAVKSCCAGVVVLAFGDGHLRLGSRAEFNSPQTP